MTAIEDIKRVQREYRREVWEQRLSKWLMYGILWGMMLSAIKEWTR